MSIQFSNNRLSGLTALTSVLLLGGLTAGSAWASGLNVYEQGAKASAAAGAFVAAADDASANWYNPAAMVWSDGSQFQMGINAITIGDDTTFTALDPNFQLPVQTEFEPESSVVTPAHFYYTHKAGDKMAWGIGLNNPFGLKTEWRDQPVTFSSFNAELQTFNLNANLAYRFADTWSFAVGLNYIFAEVPELSQEIFVATGGAPIIGFLDLSGDGDDLGFNLALSHRTDEFSFGLTYRSETSPDLDGDIEFSNFGPIAAFFPSSPATTSGLNLPAMVAAGAAFQVTDRTMVEIDVTWTGWSSFEAVNIDVLNETRFSGDLLLEEFWDDTFSYRLGFFREMGSSSELRFGVLFDQTPAPAETLRPSIPDGDRLGLSLGYGYSSQTWDLDFYYMALIFQDATAEGMIPGVIDGTFDSFSHLAGVSFNYRF